jgi:hypothetical protein
LRSRNDRQDNGQKKKNKCTNNDKQSIAQKTKDQAKKHPTKNPRMNPGAQEGFTVPVPHVVVVYFQVSISFHYYHGKIMHVTFDEIMMMS